MRIVQLSDLHVKSRRALAFNVADSTTALERAVDHLEGMNPAPDCIVITGDIAELGEREAYEQVAATLSALSVLVYAMPGNHDDRENLRWALGFCCPVDPEAEPYICYTVDTGPVRLVATDSIFPDSHSGYMHPPVARWLEKKLAEKPDMPTLVFAHHPPFLSGLGEMDEPYSRAEELARILGRHPQVWLCCGHLHRGVATVWKNIPSVVCPPLVMQIELDLSPTGGDAFSLGSPSYLLHHFHDGRLNTHFCQVPGVFPHGGPFSFSNPPSAPA